MAEQYPQGRSNETETTTKDRGFFDCFGKKEEHAKEEVVVSDEQKPSLMEKLHRSNSSSSSSSEEEVEEDGMMIRRKKKKAGLNDKIKEKLPAHKNDGTGAIPSEYNNYQAGAIPSDQYINNYQAGAIPSEYNNYQAAPTGYAEGVHPEDKKGFMEKIKDKIPGQHKDEMAVGAHPTGAIPSGHNNYQAVTGSSEGVHPEDKKGIFEKIKEKIPGQHKDEVAVAAHPTPAFTHSGVDGQYGGAAAAPHEPKEKKGILEKIKEKLPGAHKDSDEVKEKY